MISEKCPYCQSKFSTITDEDGVHLCSNKNCSAGYDPVSKTVAMWVLDIYLMMVYDGVQTSVYNITKGDEPPKIITGFVSRNELRKMFLKDQN